MRFIRHDFTLAATVVLLLNCLVTSSEGKLRLPFTTPVVQTSHPTVVHPETGNAVAVFPVNFSVSVAESFAYPIELVGGFRVRGPDFVQTHVFTGANLKLVFDVPNPGLDFVMNLTSTNYPLLQDQYGSLWRPVKPLVLEVIKQESKFTYDVGSVAMTSYQSQSESVVMPVGTPQFDNECYRTKACCGLNTTNYRKYSLVDSPVPTYACTNSSLTYRPPMFSFQLHGGIQSGSVEEKAVCVFKASVAQGSLFVCSDKTKLPFNELTVSPSYSNPSTGFMLCRQGSNLADGTYVSSPIPVVVSAFCLTNRCIGYTSRNYMTDRLSCVGSPLGYYTSQDENNTNQFSYYEKRLKIQWEASLTDLKWIDDVGMSISSTMNNISFQRDVPASTGWTLTYADFPLPLTDTVQPLFPMGRPTRLSARLNDATTPTAILVELEYVSFSNFTSASWTIQTCLNNRCASSLYPTAVEANRYPTRMNASVSLTSLGATTSPLPSEVVVTVLCSTTPTANPFRTLLAPSTITVKAAIRPSSTSTINASAARDPPQSLPSPYAASLGPSATSRILCQGDYRLSTATGTCVPLSNEECAVKYRGRRIVFNTTENACIRRAPKLTSPLVYRPLPDPLPPPQFTEENVRAMMKALRLPMFMQTMEATFEKHDAEVAGVANAEQSVEAPSADAESTSTTTDGTTRATDSESSGPIQVSWFYETSICCFVVTGLAWVFIFFRDVIYKLAGIGLWRKRKRGIRHPPAPPPTPASNVAGAEMPAPELSPAPPPPPAASASAAPQPKQSKPKKAKNAGPASAPPAPPAPPPNKATQPFTPSSRSDKHPSASHKHHRPNKKQRSHPHRHSSREQRSPRAARGASPTWYGAPPAAAAPSPLYFDAHAFAADHHTPFGFAYGGSAPEGGFYPEDYTSRSGRGGGGGEFSYHDAYEYIPVPPAYAEDPEGQRWYSFSATPPRSPPTEGASWGTSRGFGEAYGGRTPPYGGAATTHDPFGTPRSAAARSARSGQPSPFGSEQYPARSPLRRSSRVEVLSSSGAEEMRTCSPNSIGDRSHHVESID